MTTGKEFFSVQPTTRRKPELSLQIRLALFTVAMLAILLGVLLAYFVF